MMINSIVLRQMLSDYYKIKNIVRNFMESIALSKCRSITGQSISVFCLKIFNVDDSLKNGMQMGSEIMTLEMRDREKRIEESGGMNQYCQCVTPVYLGVLHLGCDFFLWKIMLSMLWSAVS